MIDEEVILKYMHKRLFFRVQASVVDDVPALQLIRTIIAEYGTADSDLLENKLKEMRILENVELPEEFADVLVKSKETTDIPSEELQSSEQVEEEEKKDDEENKDDNDEVEGAIAKKKGTDESSIEDEKEELPVPIPEPPKVRMANLCVVGGHAVNGVAEIHSEIVKDDVFNAFYKVQFSLVCQYDVVHS